MKELEVHFMVGHNGNQNIEFEEDTLLGSFENVEEFIDTLWKTGVECSGQFGSWYEYVEVPNDGTILLMYLKNGIGYEKIEYQFEKMTNAQDLENYVQDFNNYVETHGNRDDIDTWTLVINK